jgi:hypothetical protein
LAQPVTINENGRRKRIPKGQAIVKQVVNKAVTSDLKATGLVLDQVSRMEGVGEGTAAFAFDNREDALVIESVIRRIRLADESAIAIGGASENDGGKL